MGRDQSHFKNFGARVTNPNLKNNPTTDSISQSQVNIEYCITCTLCITVLNISIILVLNC